MSFSSRKKPSWFQWQWSSISYFAFLIVLGILFSGCTGKGNLRFNDATSIDEFTISGKISFPEIIETDLAASLRTSLTNLSDFSAFKVEANGITVSPGKDGSFSLSKVPVSDKLTIEASSGKIRLIKRLSLDDLYYTDLSSTELSIQSTAEALIWKHGLTFNKNLTAADIRAREYVDYVATLSTALKLALQLSPAAVPGEVNDLSAISAPAIKAAEVILEREIILRESNSVLKNAFLRKDLELLKVYISPSFSNDWDSTSNWGDFTNYYQEFFAEKTYTDVEWKIVDFEFLPNSEARVRTEVEEKVFHIASEQVVHSQKYIFDAIWRKEGSFWKVYRNMPYRSNHPTQVGADARWGEIADAHRELQAALAVENLEVFRNRISTVFGNDWDVTSTQADLLSTAQARFNVMDVKIATYTIDRIDFNGADFATVKCRAEVRVISLIPGIDIDSGVVSAEITWKKEDDRWKIHRNLPYRFSHKGK